MRKVLIFVLLATIALGEDVLTNQAGTKVTVGDWTDLTSTLTGLTGQTIPFFATGWEKYMYVPALHAYCGIGSYYEHSSEPNRNWSCYRFSDNRWFMVDMAGSFHNEHLQEGGHPMGMVNVDPTTSIAMGMQGASGSQVQ